LHSRGPGPKSRVNRPFRLAFPLKTIVALLDFSLVTDRVFEAAAELAESLHGTVLLLHVVQPSQVPAEGITSIEALQAAVTASEHHAARELERYEKRMQLDGLSASTKLLRGVPAPQVVTCAEQTGAAFIVLGSHGDGGVADRILGSVAESVLRYAPCPVIVVPHPDLRHSHPSVI
jgi:nucleotide-binding universal stress UspA family protein